MAKIKKFGEAVVITSELKLEGIKKVAKYRPKDLVVYGGEDGKEPLFAIGVTDNRFGSVSSCGAEFGAADENGFAQITMNYNGPADSVKETLADELGGALVMLGKLESSIPGVLTEIDADVAQIMANIDIG